MVRDQALKKSKRFSMAYIFVCKMNDSEADIYKIMQYFKITNDMEASQLLIMDRFSTFINKPKQISDKG